MERYENILNALPDIVYRLDVDGKFTYLNYAINCLGYTPGELLGKHFSTIIYDIDVPEVSRAIVLPKYKGKKTGDALAPKLFNERRGWLRRTQNLEIRLVKKKQTGQQTDEKVIGTVVAFGEISASGYYDQQFIGTVGIIRDISERRRAEELLRKLYCAVDQIPCSIVITDNKGIVEYINPKFIRISGYEPPDIIGQHVNILKSGHHTTAFYHDIWETISKRGDWRGEILNRTKSGDFYWEYVTISPLKDPGGETTNYIAIKEDITEKKKTAAQIKSLQEKEILIKEIHHRVKNNLQIVSSLLNIQMNHSGDEHVVKTFKECQNRINSMSIIHEKLYRSANLMKIDFSGYLDTLTKELSYSYNIKPDLIKIRVESKDIYLDVGTATPLGLIVNELVSNALLHAFPEGRAGTVLVKFRVFRAEYILEIADNGRGIPPELDIQNCASLGLELVTLLSRQLKGTLKLTKGKGSLFTLRFPSGVQDN